MKYKYKFHPSDYELGENEKFYGGMEEKGWRLVKRGAYLSKFTPVEPSAARYRIEVSAPAFLEDAGLSEGQLAVWEDCGWEHVADCHLLHIFRAPEGSDAPEFYADPAQQAGTLRKLKSNALWGWVPAAAMWGLYWLMAVMMRGGTAVSSEFRRRFIEMPPLFVLAGFLLLDGFYLTVRSGWLITRTYRRMKKGVPLDHDPRKRHLVHKVVHRTILALTALSVLLLAAQLWSVDSRDLPEEPDGPYLAVRDLGWEGERTGFMGHECGVTSSATLLADYWDVEEYLWVSEEESVFLMQDVYRLRDGRLAGWLAEALRENALFGGDGENFSSVETDAVDAAWCNAWELVAVKGPYVAYVIQTGWGNTFDPQTVCQALAARWE